MGLSDGARIDYIRRHNLEINNEQVLPYYLTSPEKIKELLNDLRENLRDISASFKCLFLINDFCGSGKTLLREVVLSDIDSPIEEPKIVGHWRSRLRYDKENNRLELLYQGKISSEDHKQLLKFGAGKSYEKAIEVLFKKSEKRDTVLKGALCKIAKSELVDLLDPNCEVCFCPLLITKHAQKSLIPLLKRLPNQFATTQILPGAYIDSDVEITSPDTPIGAICEKYYSEELEDEHTGFVKFGFDNCGLPLVLHHNTPNNSIYLLWSRKTKNIIPLFVRYERHGREGAW